MSAVMEEEIKHWTARMRSALVLEDHPGQDDGGGGEPCVRHHAVEDRDVG